MFVLCASKVCGECCAYTCVITIHCTQKHAGDGVSVLPVTAKDFEYLMSLSISCVLVCLNSSTLLLPACEQQCAASLVIDLVHDACVRSKCGLSLIPRQCVICCRATGRTHVVHACSALPSSGKLQLHVHVEVVRNPCLRLMWPGAFDQAVICTIIHRRGGG
jgi:hypothetical protein